MIYWCTLTPMRNTSRSWIRFWHACIKTIWKLTWRNAFSETRKSHTWVSHLLQKESNRARINSKPLKTLNHPPMSRPSGRSWVCATSSGLTSRTLLWSRRHCSSSQERIPAISPDRYQKRRWKLSTFCKNSSRQNQLWLSRKQTDSTPSSLMPPPERRTHQGA